jgi:hypothetical protein
LFRCSESIQCYFRQDRAHGDLATPPPTVEFDFAEQCDDAGCRGYMTNQKYYLSRFNRAADWGSARAAWRPTASVLDLGDFATFGDYSTAVSRKSGGNINRSVAKAVRSGYQCCNLGTEIDRYAGSIRAINRSKLFRTGGIVFDAFIPSRDRPQDEARPPVPPRCPRHWLLQFGVFAPATQKGQLVAYITVGRTGNLLRLWHLMGHGDFLRHEVVKFLLFDVIQWLLDRQDPNVEGLRYFMYGAVEHGREGLLEWKSRMQFRPVLLGPP